MQNKIHYEENLFFLNLQLKLLQESFQLELDPEFFLDKLLTDIKFLDECLGSLLAALRENHHLIRRAEYFHNLIKVEMAFVDLLEAITTDQFPFCACLSCYKDGMLERLAVHKSNIAEVKNVLKQLIKEDDKQEDVLTTEELNLLTRLHSDEEELF